MAVGPIIKTVLKVGGTAVASEKAAKLVEKIVDEAEKILVDIVKRKK